MTTVSTSDTPVKSPIDELFQWLDRMRKRGDLPEASATGRANALRQLLTILEDDEPRDPRWLLEHIDAIVRRWAVRNDAKPDTARTYSSRAKTAIESYLSYLEDPTTFRFHVRDATAKKPTEKTPADEPKRGRLVAPRAVSTEAPKPELALLGQGPVRTFPLGAGRSPFSFRLPEDMKVADVAKIACHLLTMAGDFDPTNPGHAQVFAIVTKSF